MAGTPVDSLPLVVRLARERCGGLIASAMSAGAYLSGRTDLLPALTNAGTSLGIALQHRNDIQDFTVAFDQRIKPPLADLLSGQPNLVVCCLLQVLPRMKPKERALFQALHGRNLSKPAKPLTEIEFSAVLEIANRYGATYGAAQCLTSCVKRARRALFGCPPSPVLEEYNGFLELVLQP